MWSKAKVVWSPCEIDYLKSNKKSRSVNELSLYLGKSRAAIKRKLDELDGKIVPKTNKKGTTIGKRNDILINGKPCFFRSAWEANICRWFIHSNIEWEYEPKVFYFPNIKTGTNSYCPDFYLKKEDIWVEVKGFLDPRSKVAINRFKKFYPEEFKKLYVIVGSPGTNADSFFKKLNIPVLIYIKDANKKYKNVITGWE